MPQQLPDNVRESVRELVYSRADDANYLAQGRVENGEFMNRLVAEDSIGGLLRQYMPSEEVKTYIKDAVLNRYAKERRAGAQSGYETSELIYDDFGASEKIGEQGHVSLYKSTERENSYCVVSEGTCLKWETALRHALYYYITLPEETQDADVRVALRCSSPRGALAASDKDHIRNALEKVNVEFYCIEF